MYCIHYLKIKLFKLFYTDKMFVFVIHKININCKTDDRRKTNFQQVIRVLITAIWNFQYVPADTMGTYRLCKNPTIIKSNKIIINIFCINIFDKIVVFK